MPKPIPKRPACKIFACYVDETAVQVRQIIGWVFNPNKLECNSNTVFFNSTDLIVNNITVSVAVEQLSYFIKGINETGAFETKPTLMVWDKHQLNFLLENIPELTKKFVKPNIVLLQDRCADFFKYDLRVQDFSLYSISEAMGFNQEGVQDYIKFAKIAIQIERAWKKQVASLRPVPEKKNGKKIPKTQRGT